MRYVSLFILLSILFLSACDNMRPEPIESALSHLSSDELMDKLDASLERLEYAEGDVGVNLGRVGMRMELRTAQSCLEQLGYYDGPRLGILDPTTIEAIERYLHDRSVAH